MEKIDETFYKLDEVRELVEFCKKNQKPKRLWLRRLALLENLNSYYLFAVSSVLLSQESFWKNTELLKEGKFNTNEYDYANLKSHSSAISFYNHGRICIETTRSLSGEAIFFLKQKRRPNCCKNIEIIIGLGRLNLLIRELL